VKSIWLGVLGGVLLAGAAMAAAPATPPAVGQPAPAFTLALFDGRQVMLQDFRGKPLVLNFWSSG